MIHNVLVNNPDGTPIKALPRLEHEISVGDLRLLLLPPGRCDVGMVMDNHLINVNHTGGEMMFACNSDVMRPSKQVVDGLGYWPTGASLKIDVVNHLPECCVEVCEHAMADWLNDSDVPMSRRQEVLHWRRDAVGADIGRTAVSFLIRAANSKQRADQLTAEALAIGIASRILARKIRPDGDADEELSDWARRGDNVRIGRAIEFVDEHIRDPLLSIGDLAAAANLSLPYFGAVFKSVTGKAPYSYILERRARFARDLIRGTRSSLADIAFQSGFSSQAHMTTVVKRFYRTTPGMMRNGG